MVLELFKLIPNSLRQAAIDSLVEVVVEKGEELLSESILNKIRGLRSDAVFRQQFEAGLQRGLKRFFDEYQLEDEDLVAAMATEKDLFTKPAVRQALLTILQQPGRFFVEERIILEESFDLVLPQRLNRQRVDQAVAFLLQCLARELWQLPELRSIYLLEFQRLTAEAAREQVQLQKAQLATLESLDVGIREALLQFTNALSLQKEVVAQSNQLGSPSTRPAVYHNLPQSDYGEFVGREGEIQQIAKLLRPFPQSRHHLIVIDGIGGIGKSTLALEVAHRCLYASVQAAHSQQQEQGHLTQLRQLLVERFSEDELRTLCFEIALDYDMLPGQGKGGKARELVAYLERRNRLGEMIEAIRRLRSDIREAELVNAQDGIIELAEKFDAVIWTSAKQSVLTAEGIQPRYQILHTLDDIYTTIADCLQREEINRASSDEQARLIHQILSQNRILLIVDNLETIDDETVLTFLRELPAPTKAIVTTRHRIDIAYSVRLRGMEQADAQELIRQEAIRRQISLTMAQTQRFVTHTGGVPLAIVWSIAQIGYGHPANTVLHRLGQPNSDIIRFCFEGSLEQIRNRPAHELLKALSLFTPDGSREALGKVAALSQLDRDAGLATLEKLSLVNKDSNRFSLLPITKTLAKDELQRDPQDALIISRRWVDYFIGLYRDVDGLQNTYRLRHRGRLFPSDGHNFLAAIEWADENGSTEDIAWLSFGALSFLDSQGRWNALIELTHRILEQARLASDLGVLGHLMDTKGWLHEQRGEFAKAKTAFYEGLAAYQALGNKEGEASLLQRLSGIYRKQEAYEKAQDFIEQARLIAQEPYIGDLVALIDTQEGKLARDLQEWERSWLLFSRVQSWFEKRTDQTPKDEDLAVGIWGHLAIVAFRLGRPEEAKRLCLRSIDYFEKVGTKGYLATLKYRLALCEQALGNDEVALQHVNEAIKWYRQLGMKPDLPDALALRDSLI